MFRPSHHTLTPRLVPSHRVNHPPFKPPSLRIHSVPSPSEGGAVVAASRSPHVPTDHCRRVQRRRSLMLHPPLHRGSNHRGTSFCNTQQHPPSIIRIAQLHGPLMLHHQGAKAPLSAMRGAIHPPSRRAYKSDTAQTLSLLSFSSSCDLDFFRCNLDVSFK
ncbi:hypothetical protein HN51_053033 [Arachis hypogaea]